MIALDRGTAVGTGCNTTLAVKVVLGGFQFPEAPLYETPRFCPCPEPLTTGEQ